MLFSLLDFLVRLVLGAGARQHPARDIELLVLRHQVKVLQRQVKRPRLSRVDRVLFAAASTWLPRGSWSSFMVRPETMLCWHRELVRRKWTFRVSATTIRTVLRTARAGPAPRRSGPTGSQFLQAHSEAIIACDFFTVETAWLRTLDVLVFIELGSRRIHVSPSTVHPDSAWVTQQARNLLLGLDARRSLVRFLVRDRDAKFPRSFDTVLRSKGIRVIRTAVRAPNANAYAERVIETIRAECLDWTLILGRGHLDRTLRTYVEYYNRQRPHRALALAPPLAEASIPIPVDPRDVRRRDLLGGLIVEYERVAA